MEYEGLMLERVEGVAVLTLNRPEKLNSFTQRMGSVVFPSLFRELQEDDDVHALIITGSGKGFCTGADVTGFASSDDATSDVTRYERLQALGNFILHLYNLEKPVIAAINGVVAGAGISIAALSDIRIASENARFSMTFVSRGLIPDSGATFAIPKLIGLGKSFELMYTGDTIDAREAERIGLVNKVVPHDRLMDEAMTLCKKLAKAAPLALALIKRTLHAGLINDLERQLYLETYAQNICFGTDDFKEGISSFLEKRDPHFTGR